MVGIGVIGTGYWGKNHVRVFKELLMEGKIDTLKICDTNEERVKELAKIFSVEYVTDYREFFDDGDIKAVSIATSSPTHYTVATGCLENHMDVLIEKPMTLDVKEAESLVRFAEKKHSQIMVGHIFRYHPAIKKLGVIIGRGELGKLQLMFSRRLDYGPPRTTMGVLDALGTHEVDMFCHLTGSLYPEEITANVSRVFNSRFEETASIVLGFKDGVKCYAMESWMHPGGKVRDLVVVGSEKSARVDYLNPNEIEIFDKRICKDGNGYRLENTQTTKVPVGFEEPLKVELEHFVDCVKMDFRPITTGNTGLRVVKIIDAAKTSAKLGTTIQFDEGGYVVV